MSETVIINVKCQSTVTVIVSPYLPHSHTYACAGAYALVEEAVSAACEEAGDDWVHILQKLVCRYYYYYYEYEYEYEYGYCYYYY